MSRENQRAVRTAINNAAYIAGIEDKEGQTLLDNMATLRVAPALAKILEAVKDSIKNDGGERRKSDRGAWAMAGNLMGTGLEPFLLILQSSLFHSQLQLDVTQFSLFGWRVMLLASDFI
jgi:hypothetical protein